ncbi:hypothetical protein BD770DRAFT_396312 [Pilaira anomala]|nr:hypothetical protein BD770DRAFT_396312 [Pilaira anomala]
MSGLLPDSTPVKELLERIAQEKKWSKEAVESDCAILDRNRLVYVQDLRALSKESWAQIELLPLVKDLLRGEIDPESASSGEESNTKKKDKKEKKKDEEGGKKKDKKKKDKQKQKGFKSPSLLGTPVVPTILSRPSPPIHDLQQGDTSSILSDSSLSQDPITVQNTIRNGNIIDVTPALPTPINTQRTLSVNTITSSGVDSSSDYEDDDDDDDELLSPSSRKCVTFSNETAIGIAASEKTDAEKEKKKEKKKDKKKKNKDMASINKCSGYTNFTSHPYTTHPIVKFKKMKMKHCKRLPEVPKDDLFLQRIHDRLKLSTDS